MQLVLQIFKWFCMYTERISVKDCLIVSVEILGLYKSLAAVNEKWSLVVSTLAVVRRRFSSEREWAS